MTRKNRLKAKVKPFAEILGGVGDISRLSILYTLAHRPMDVREIIDITGIPGSLMSHHLSVLYKRGWVDKIKYGKRIEYRIRTGNFLVMKKLFVGTPETQEIFQKD